MVARGAETAGLGDRSIEGRARERMVNRLREQGINDESVLRAMAVVPRHAFVDEALRARAYDDAALPIGLGQSISQPFVVARMTALVAAGALQLGRPVLEVGFGCGYQSAVLAELGVSVYGLERIGSFVREARERLHALGTRRVRLAHADGTRGWSEFAPFGGILVAAAGQGVPKPLAAQLCEGARLVIPVGEDGEQHLLCVTRTANGYEQRQLDAVSFVPLVPGPTRA